MKSSFHSFLAAFYLVLGLMFCSSVTAAERPNIIFIVADDMGYADISSFGSPDIQTPNIDRLATEGLKFTNIYALGPECTPSRVSYLTGRYPQRVGGMECAIGTGDVGRYDDAIRLAEAGDLGLPAGEATLAPALKRAGYRTAVFGKWHLGYREKFSPLEQGFDEFIGFLGGNVDYFRHRELSDIHVYLSGKENLTREGYTTDLITDDAVKFLKAHGTDSTKPFFLYLPHAAPHFPFQAPNDDDGGMPAVETWTQGSRDTYREMMVSFDQSVQAILDTLDELKIAENTLVVFTSDHGGMKPADNRPWRDYKGTLFEGGLRVPLAMRWPAKIPAGKTSDQVGTLMDLTCSFLNLAKAEVPARGLDGEDLLAHALSDQPDHPRTLHWRAKRAPRTWWATRHGDWKWIRKDDDGKKEAWLFHLGEDPQESNNLLENPTPGKRSPNSRPCRSSGSRKSPTHEA